MYFYEMASNSLIYVIHYLYFYLPEQQPNNNRDFYDCTIASVLTEGTVTVSWDNHDDDDDDESGEDDDDELPMVYLRSSNGAEDEESSGGTEYSVCAIFNMKDLTPDAFTESLQDRFRDDLAEALDMSESQVIVSLSFALRSLIFVAAASVSIRQFSHSLSCFLSFLLIFFFATSYYVPCRHRSRSRTSPRARSLSTCVSLV